MNLNPGQKAALRFVAGRYRAGEKLSKLAGAAGTGKTTMIQAVIEELAGGQEFDEDNPGAGGAAVLAPTNKAAMVLRSKGIVRATTVHRATTKPRVAKEGVIKELELQLEEAEARGDAALVDTLGLRLEGILAPSFRPSEDTPYKEASLIIADEASMIDEERGKLLLALGPPVLIVGDPYQLAPVKSISLFLRDLRTADTVELTHVERQGAGSGILTLATAIREGSDPTPGQIDASCSVVDLSDERKMRLWAAAQVGLLRDADVTIVGTNKNRVLFNKKIRNIKHGLTDTAPPINSEPFISYTTNRFWGMAKNDNLICKDWVTQGSIWKATIETPNDTNSRVMNSNAPHSVYAGHFRELHMPTDWTFSRHTRAAQGTFEIDFAYSLTAHRMQGSEADSVVVLADRFVERMGEEDRRRWLYTAVTRARKKCVLIVNSPWH